MAASVTWASWVYGSPAPLARVPPKLDLMPAMRGYPYGFGEVRTELPYQLWQTLFALRHGLAPRPDPFKAASKRWRIVRASALCLRARDAPVLVEKVVCTRPGRSEAPKRARAVGWSAPAAKPTGESRKARRAVAYAFGPSVTIPEGVGDMAFGNTNICGRSSFTSTMRSAGTFSCPANCLGVRRLLGAIGPLFIGAKEQGHALLLLAFPRPRSGCHPAWRKSAR